MRRRMRASSAGVTKSGTMTAPWAKMLSVSRGMLSLQVRSGRPYGRSARTPAAGPAGVETDERSEAGLEAVGKKGDRRRSTGPRVGREKEYVTR